jgi:hypothetical protein
MFDEGLILSALRELSREELDEVIDFIDEIRSKKMADRPMSDSTRKVPFGAHDELASANLSEQHCEAAKPAQGCATYV